MIDDCSIIAVAPTAIDNCAGTIYASTIDSLFYFSEGTHTIHWTYDDGNGNSSSQTQKVIINYGKTFGDSSAIVCNSFNWYGIEYTESGTPTHTIKNKFGCDSIITLSLTITTCTGINNNKISNINIYPSPVNNEFVIENKGNTQVLFYEIFNSIGQIIVSGNFTDKVIINSSSFSAGIYLIKLESEKGYEFKKIVKEN